MLKYPHTHFPQFYGSHAVRKDKQMYSFNSRVRYSECDSEGKLTLPSLLNYFQDCSTFHSESLGLGIEYLKKNHLVWVLASWQIVAESYPKLYEEMEIGTFPYEFKGFMGMRNFYMKTKQGEYTARANSLWSLLSTDNWKPTTPPVQMKEGYQIEPRLPMDYAPRKIAIPENGKCEEPIVVRKHHLDTNHHVNNGQYISIALEYLPEGFLIGQMRAEYKKQAFLDNILYPYVVNMQGALETAGKDRYVVSLQDEQGVPYVNMEFA